MLYERTAISKKPDEVAKAEIAALRSEDRLTPDLVFRDPYILDFLGLKDRYLEKDLEDAILRELETFLLELGNGFAFLGRQNRIQIDSDDFYLDLLFYHRALKRIIAIDLHPVRYDTNKVSLCLCPSKSERRPVLYGIHQRSQAQDNGAPARDCSIHGTPATSNACLLRGLPFPG